MRILRLKWFKRTLAFAFAIVILGCLALFSIDFYIKQTAKSHIVSAEEAARLNGVDCILILGCGVNGSVPSPMLKDRLEKGISLYEQNTSNKLLVSGDHGQENYNEVSVMKQYAIDAGIPSNDVFMDHAGFSTYDSMYRAREVFCAKKVIIVTQAYHLPRALYVANALGLDAYGVAAESQSYAGQAYRDFRELLARNKDFIYVHCSLKPSVLGDAIPVSGDGDITNN